MVFAPDTEAGIAAAVELVNTARRRDGHDAMATLADVAEFYTRWGYSVGTTATRPSWPPSATPETRSPGSGRSTATRPPRC